MKTATTASPTITSTHNPFPSSTRPPTSTTHGASSKTKPSASPHTSPSPHTTTNTNHTAAASSSSQPLSSSPPSPSSSSGTPSSSSGGGAHGKSASNKPPVPPRITHTHTNTNTNTSNKVGGGAADEATDTVGAPTTNGSGNGNTSSNSCNNSNSNSSNGNGNGNGSSTSGPGSVSPTTGRQLPGVPKSVASTIKQRPAPPLTKPPSSILPQSQPSSSSPSSPSQSSSPALNSPPSSSTATSREVENKAVAPAQPQPEKEKSNTTSINGNANANGNGSGSGNGNGNGGNGTGVTGRPVPTPPVSIPLAAANEKPKSTPDVTPLPTTTTAQSSSTQNSANGSLVTNGPPLSPKSPPPSLSSGGTTQATVQPGTTPPTSASAEGTSSNNGSLTSSSSTATTSNSFVRSTRAAVPTARALNESKAALVSAHRNALSPLRKPQITCSDTNNTNVENTGNNEDRSSASSTSQEGTMGAPNGSEISTSVDQLRTSSPSISCENLGKCVVEHNGLVKLGTVEGLVIRLTSENGGEDLHFMLHFLLTHNGHTPPARLLELLIARYNYHPTIPPADMDSWTKNVLTPIRLRVFNVLRTWIERLWNSSTQAELISRVREFLEETSAAMKNPAERVLHSLNRAVSGEETKKQIVFDRQPPLPLLPLDIALGQQYNASTSFSMQTLHMKEIARQLTLVEQSIYCAIKPWELIGLSWTKKDKTLAPNVSKMIQHFNKISKWIYEEITAADDLPTRIRVLERFIELADYLEQLQNYNALMEVIAGLTNSIVHRMKKTWTGISPWHSTTFDSCKHLMESTKNNARLRQKLHNIHPPCIPYLGVYLTDLTFIEEGNPTWIEDKVNFTKCRLQATVILEVQQYQQAPYCLEPVLLLAEWLNTRGSASTEELCYKKSCLLEPKDTTAEETPAELPPPVSPSNDVQLLVLHPGELEPSPVSVRQTMTIGEVICTILDKWVKTVQNPNNYTKTFLENMGKTTCSLIAPTLKSQPGFMVAACQILSDLLTSQPNFSKKGGNFFALLPSQVFVNTAFVSADTCTTAVTVIDGNAPLVLMEPLFATAFEAQTELVFLYYDNDTLVKWLNGNLSYNDHRLSGSGVVVVMPIDQIIRPETEEQIRNRVQNINFTEGALCGYMNKFEARFHSYCFKPVQVEVQPRTRKTQAFTKEKRRWLVVMDSFLLCYSDSQDPFPKRIMALQFYDVVLVRDNSQLCIMLKRNVHRPKEEKPFVIAAPQEEQTRHWFAVLSTKSRVNENTKQFGIDMKVISSRPEQRLVPPVMREVLNCLYLRAIGNDKIFTQEGNYPILEKLKSQFDSGQPLDQSFTDYVTLGEVVKLYLAELPEPLLTSSLYPKFAKVGEMMLSRIGQGAGDSEILTLKWLIQQLPFPNSALLTYVLSFLRYWSSECGQDLQKVASIFGPFFLRPNIDSDSHPPADTIDVITYVTVLLLRFQDKLCKTESELVPLFREKFGRVAFSEPSSSIHILQSEVQMEIATMVKDAQMTGYSKKRAQSSSSNADPTPEGSPVNSPTTAKSVKRSQDDENSATKSPPLSPSDSGPDTSSDQASSPSGTQNNSTTTPPNGAKPTPAPKAANNAHQQSQTSTNGNTTTNNSTPTKPGSGSNNTPATQNSSPSTLRKPSISPAIALATTPVASTSTSPQTGRKVSVATQSRHAAATSNNHTTTTHTLNPISNKH
ncbi:cell division control protein [Pelomyxa schiedti]|nr:cell division control protein [Pelomyxa schiedti]